MESKKLLIMVLRLITVNGRQNSFRHFKRHVWMRFGYWQRKALIYWLWEIVSLNASPRSLFLILKEHRWMADEWRLISWSITDGNGIFHIYVRTGNRIPRIFQESTLWCDGAEWGDFQDFYRFRVCIRIFMWWIITGRIMRMKILPRHFYGIQDRMWRLGDEKW